MVARLRNVKIIREEAWSYYNLQVIELELDAIFK